MRKRRVIALAVALFLACLLAYSIFRAFPNRSLNNYFTSRYPIGKTSCFQNYYVNASHTFGHSILAYVPHLILATAKSHLHNSDKHTDIRQTKKRTKISIFEGRSADKNLAIFRILVAVGPLSIGDIQRRLNKISGLEVTYYASLNKRIHALVRDGYLGEVKPADSGQAGFKVTLFEVLPKFYLAYYLNGKSREEILSRLNQPNATVILSDLINAEEIVA
ncbi:MAG: hypothetical protein ACQCN4_07695 [Candidatus Bathyarchaeia archaeon]